MPDRSARPLIVQSDKSLLLEVDGPVYETCRDALAPFCELVKSPEHVHTYRITPLSIWNAAAAGCSVEQMTETLEQFGRFGVPGNVARDIRDLHSRYGRMRLEPDPEAELRKTNAKFNHHATASPSKFIGLGRSSGSREPDATS